MDTAVWTLIGFALGILASIIAGIRLSYRQFKYSTAGYRVKMVAEATPQIVETINANGYTGIIRDKYRYSLGVILDELAQKFGDSTFNPDGPWPLIINPEGDRWERFDKYIRPVIADINVYAFVAYFPSIFDWLYDRAILKQLEKLTALCQQLETVVGDLDAAFDAAPKVVRVEGDALYPNNQADPILVKRLVDVHRQLYETWTEWKTVTCR